MAKRIGHLPVVQGFVWRALGMSEPDAVAVSAIRRRPGLSLRRCGWAASALEAQTVLAAVLVTVEDLLAPVTPAAEI